MFSKILFWNLLLRGAKLDSWAVPFAQYIHARKLLCAMPSVNLINNIGFDEDSTHTNLEHIFVSVEAGSIELPIGPPLQVSRNRTAEREISRQMFRRLLKSLLRDPVLLLQVVRRAFARFK
jgi:hypothetical protein